MTKDANTDSSNGYNWLPIFGGNKRRTQSITKHNQTPHYKQLWVWEFYAFNSHSTDSCNPGIFSSLFCFSLRRHFVELSMRAFYKSCHRRFWFDKRKRLEMLFEVGCIMSSTMLQTGEYDPHTRTQTRVLSFFCLDIPYPCKKRIIQFWLAR